MGCSSGKERKETFFGKRFNALTVSETGLDFINSIKESPSRNIGAYDYFYNGGGVAIGDINNDDLPDIFLTGNDVPSQLYLNQGNLNFKNITQSARIEDNKWSTGALMVDINSDGWLDIYVCHSGPDWKEETTENYLYVNNRDGTFTERASELGIEGNGLSTHAIFFDMDGDQDLDLFVINHAVRNVGNSIQDWLQATRQLPPEVYSRFSNKLYRNEGNNSFTDISKDAGIYKIGFALGVATYDFNNDGHLDIYIANDYFIPDFLYLNDGNGNFSESISHHFSHLSYFSMGCDVSDINNDGFSDLVTLDMTPKDHFRNKMMMSAMSLEDFKFLDEIMLYQPQYMFNSLQINNGAGTFCDIAHLAGIAQTDWSWAPLIADFDNDGYKDLFVSNGIYRDVKNNDWRLELINMINENELDSASYFNHLEKANSTPLANEVFKNLDGYQLKEMNLDWGLNQKGFSNGAAYGDLDNDGDLDLVINNLGQESMIYKNNSEEYTGSNFVQFQFKDPIHFAHAKLEIYSKNELQSQTFQVSRGYQSSVDPIVHFGMGEETHLDSLVIKWPSGELSVITDLNINQRHLLGSDIEKRQLNEKPKALPKFANVSVPAIQPPAFHSENTFDDFESEILLPHRMSTLGPAIAVGDINHDNLDDFYLSGGVGELGSFYTQNANGFFQELSILRQRCMRTMKN